ncbi:MAG TPA: helix-turn-helix domain-containing protein [Ktedonobacterales bacterium]|nr:helix-turn-helix domain-containing protein [Ktedonobacterales bacterium]
MEDIPETYNLETLEQLRAAADPLRVRIVAHLSRQAMTVTQLAGVLGEVPAKLHYHVRELEKVGLLKLVETREKGGILEKYYRAVAKTINAPGTLFQDVPPDEVEGMLNEVTQPFFQGFIQTTQHMLRTQAWDDPDQRLVLSPEYYWMTADEFRQVNRQIDALLNPYREPRGIDREREQALLWLGYTVAPSAGQEDEAAVAAPPEAAPAPARAPKREMSLVAGVTHFSRKDLEQALAGGQVLDVYVLGACIFADDVTPDLVERAVHSFRLWGKLSASPEVREVLKRKGGESGQKTPTGA